MSEEYYRICLRPLPGLIGYRGLQRLGPVPREADPADSPFNAACIEYINQGDRIGSRQVASELFHQIRESTEEYELIRLQLYTVPFVNPDGFIGFDICQNYWNSLLSWDWSGGPSWQSTQSNLILMRVVFDLFASQLNANRLIADCVSAERFVRAVHALRTVCPGTWESPGHEDYDMVAISVVEGV